MRPRGLYWPCRPCWSLTPSCEMRRQGSWRCTGDMDVGLQGPSGWKTRQDAPETVWLPPAPPSWELRDRLEWERQCPTNCTLPASLVLTVDADGEWARSVSPPLMCLRTRDAAPTRRRQRPGRVVPSIFAYRNSYIYIYMRRRYSTDTVRVSIRVYFYRIYSGTRYRTCTVWNSCVNKKKTNWQNQKARK